jgi:hypothetical protein
MLILSISLISILTILITLLSKCTISWNTNEDNSVIELSFKSKNQGPLIMITQIYYHQGTIVFGKCLYSSNFPLKFNNLIKIKEI